MKIYRIIFILCLFAHTALCQYAKKKVGSPIIYSNSLSIISPTNKNNRFELRGSNGTNRPLNFQGYSEDLYKKIKSNEKYIAGANLNGQVLIWKIRPDTIVHYKTILSQSNINDFEFIDTNKLVIASALGQIEFWELNSFKMIKTQIIHNKAITGIKYNGDKLLYTVSLDSTLKCINLPKLNVINTFNAPQPLLNISLGNDLIAIADFSNTIHFLSTKFEYHSKKAGLHKSVITKLIFSDTPEFNDLIISSSWDKSICFYNYKENKIISRIDGLDDYIMDFVILKNLHTILITTRNNYLYSIKLKNIY